MKNWILRSFKWVKSVAKHQISSHLRWEHSNLMMYCHATKAPGLSLKTVYSPQIWPSPTPFHPSKLPDLRKPYLHHLSWASFCGTTNAPALCGSNYMYRWLDVVFTSLFIHKGFDQVSEKNRGFGTLAITSVPGIATLEGFSVYSVCILWNAPRSRMTQTLSWQIPNIWTAVHEDWGESVSWLRVAVLTWSSLTYFTILISLTFRSKGSPH